MMLGCLAPPHLTAFITEAFSETGRRILPLGRSSPCRGNDPFRIKERTHELRDAVEGLLLVAPKQMGPRRSVPGSVVNGMPVGLLFANDINDLHRWRAGVLRQHAGRREWAVMAMRLGKYLQRARRFRLRLGRVAGPTVRSWLADEITWHELCGRLALGPRLALYFGHATSAGFSGYLGLGWEQVITAPLTAPCGVMVCFACDVLKRDRGRLPFGCRWVLEGRSGAVWGAVGSVPTDANTKLADLFIDILSIDRPPNIGAALRGVSKALKATGSNIAGTAFSGYRLIGDPLQSLL